MADTGAICHAVSGLIGYAHYLYPWPPATQAHRKPIACLACRPHDHSRMVRTIPRRLLHKRWCRILCNSAPFQESESATTRVRRGSMPEYAEWVGTLLARDTTSSRVRAGSNRAGSLPKPQHRCRTSGHHGSAMVDDAEREQPQRVTSPIRDVAWWNVTGGIQRYLRARWR